MAHILAQRPELDVDETLREARTRADRVAMCAKIRVEVDGPMPALSVLSAAAMLCGHIAAGDRGGAGQ